MAMKLNSSETYFFELLVNFGNEKNVDKKDFYLNEYDCEWH